MPSFLAAPIFQDHLTDVEVCLKRKVPLDCPALIIPPYYSYQSLLPCLSKCKQAKPRMLQIGKQMMNQCRQRPFHLYTAVCIHVSLCTSNPAISGLQSSLEITMFGSFISQMRKLRTKQASHLLNLSHQRLSQ